MKLRYAALTDAGRVREINEDGYLATGRVFAVADGMGGHQAGEIASTIALKSLEKSLKELPSRMNMQKRIKTSIHRANLAIMEEAGEPGRSGMGTTLTVVVPTRNRIHIGHVGDSRAYLFRDGKLQRLTEDHSLVAQMVRDGRLNPSEAEIHPLRSVLTRALGTPSVEIDLFSTESRLKDKILLCTDGLTSMLKEKEIGEILSENLNPQTLCQKLVEAANDRGGIDNVTVILIEISGIPKRSKRRILTALKLIKMSGRRGIWSRKRFT
ncbi:MAG: Stp1/IreP family PP2C-type Ser/Thr phosphatase [Actinomycetota bacterium]